MFIGITMSNRIVVLACVAIALASCTASPSAPGGSASTHARSPEGGAAADGLQPVKDYAQEFCGGGAVPDDCPKGAVPDALRRAMHIPSIKSGAACPVSESNPHIWSRQAPGLGHGPVAPVGLGIHSTLRFLAFRGSRWGGQKVLWVASSDYLGPILIRGGRVDGEGAVGFDLGSGLPLAELQLPPGRTINVDRGYREWPSHTRITEPGCYAYQVDGTDFSYVVVFEAVPGR
jgi:hypothetical protein